MSRNPGSMKPRPARKPPSFPPRLHDAGGIHRVAQSASHDPARSTCDAAAALNVETLHLEGPGGDGLRAAFAPAANMVLHSLTLGGRELLASRNGLEGYVERGSTMGVPLLHPWANRLGGLRYSAAGKDVALDPDSGLFKQDPGGLPIHGAWPVLLQWDVLESDSDDEAASLLARLEWSRRHAAFELFPFPH